MTEPAVDPNVNPDQAKEPGAEDKVTMTPEEFEAAKQEAAEKEAERRVAKVLSKKQAEWQEAKDKELEEAKSEAAKLAKMSAEERKAEEDKAKQELLDKREKELNMREYRYEAKHQLEENGLPDSFVDMVLSEDAETTKNNIGAIKAEFDKAIEAAVNEKLKGNNPKAGGRTGALTKGEILKVSDTVERQRLIAENINLFK
ncbi:DUF4355 domain-containing protein [Leuconostoc falkenbergense]|uniref:DUF4355 domain-containing protein n=1 Tax=Leuconostoc falkenbergense TaxID=2766470 RepID=UPI0029588C3F|nr:DUF4355 domain-containing protein [Leuconostoc falkenbergense]MDV8951203.1 DUF4355 domain-containing protein [Leuconostoc falkenbergense]